MQNGIFIRTLESIIKVFFLGFIDNIISKYVTFNASSLVSQSNIKLHIFSVQIIMYIRNGSSGIF